MHLYLQVSLGDEGDDLVGARCGELGPDVEDPGEGVMVALLILLGTEGAEESGLGQVQPPLLRLLLDLGVLEEICHLHFLPLALGPLGQTDWPHLLSPGSWSVWAD